MPPFCEENTCGFSDTARTSSGQPVTISVLANDNDPDGNTLTIVSVTQPAAGSVVVNGSTLVWTSDIGPHWLPASYVGWPGYRRRWNALSWAARLT